MQIIDNYPLKALNTFSVEAHARRFAEFNSLDELNEILQANRAESLFILGGGSNILITGNLDNLVLKNNIQGIDVLREDQEHVFVRAGAGVNWHQFVLYCIDHGLGGVENLSLIPGCVGASPIQNIGAYGVEVRDVFQELEAFDINECAARIFSLEECKFGYRESVFKHRHKGRFVISSVTFRLNKKPNYNISYGAIRQELERMGIAELSIRAVSDAVINIRRSKLPDPAVIGNAGSFFKNPLVTASEHARLISSYPDIVSFDAGEGNKKLAAGWLIEQCGWKGYREGDAGCHEKQALVLVNYGTARGSDILTLSEKIKESVLKKFGVRLETEVNIV
jgi:UDP-N-acetylmuramate dehydrogenase